MTNTIIPAEEIYCEDYIRSHGTLAYKTAYYDIERLLKEGRRISIIADKKRHGFTATQFYKINLLDRDHIAELLANKDLIFTGDIENQPHNMGWFAASKSTIKKILAEVKPIFAEAQKLMEAKAAEEAKALEAEELAELAELQAQMDRYELLKKKHGGSQEVAA